MQEKRPKRTTPSESTRVEEAREACVEIGDPDAADSEHAPQAEPPPVDERVGRHYREMSERGAHQAGEGRVP